MKVMRLLLLLATTWVVSLSGVVKKRVQPYTVGEPIRALTSQYRTPKAYGNLQETVYFQLPVCEEESGAVEIVAISIIMPGNAAFRNGTWETQHGLIDMEVSSTQAFRKGDIVTTNYGWAGGSEPAAYNPMNQVRFAFNTTAFKSNYVFIRVKSFRAPTSVVMEVTYEKLDPDGGNKPTPFMHDPKAFPTVPANPNFIEMVQYAQTKDPDLFVSGDDFIYFNVKFCSNGVAPGSWMTATAVGIDKLTQNDGQPAPSQTALNIILCEVTSQKIPVSTYCINPGIPLVVDHDFSASPVVAMRTPINIFNIQNFIIGVQGQGGYRTEDPPNDAYNRGKNDFALAIQLGSH